MNFTLKQLTYFVAAAETGKVIEAAERVFVSQPSISAAIMHLEDWLQVRLFIRHHQKGLLLTHEGEVFLVKVKTLLSCADELQQFAKTLHTNEQQQLNLAGFPSFAASFLPRYIQQFKILHPEAQIQLHESQQQELLKDIADIRYDLGATYYFGALSSSLEFIPLTSHSPYLLVSENHPLYSETSVSLDACRNMPLAILDWPISQQYFMEICKDHQLHDNVIFFAQSIAMLQAQIVDGSAIALLTNPEINLAHLDGTAFKKLSLLELLDPLAVGFVHCMKLPLSDLATEFIAFCQQQVH